MDEPMIRINEIPEGDRSRRFGPFTSAVSATAIAALFLLLTIIMLGHM